MHFALQTQASGLPLNHLAPASPSQPHLLRFVGIAFDEGGYEIDRLATMVKPISPTCRSSKIPEGAVDLYERAKSEGIEPSDAFEWFMEKSRTANRIVGHDLSRHIQVMQILGARLTGQIWTPACPLFCTMTGATPILNLAPRFEVLAAGRRDPRPPTVAECVRHFFDEAMQLTGDPEADLEACIRVFHRLASS